MQLPLPLTRNITLLGTEQFNLYLVKGETYAVIEGGVSAITYPFLKQLSDLGVAPEAISHLVVLHSHFDHMMVFPSLKKKFPAMKITSSEANRASFSSQKILSKIFESDRKMTMSMKENRLVSQTPDLQPMNSYPLDLPLRDGSILDLGDGVKIRFIEIPGHSPDCMAAYFEKDGVLLCSDGSGFYTPPDLFKPNYYFRLDSAEKSLEKMADLNATVLARGHYGAVSGKGEVRRHFERARQCIEDFKAFVLRKIEGGVPTDKITEELTETFSKGVLELLPPEENYRLWGLLIRRTLECFEMSKP